MRVKFGCPAKMIPNMSNASRSSQLAVGQTAETLGTCSPSPACALTRKRSFFAKEYRLSTTSKRFSRFGQSTAVKSESRSNSSSSRKYCEISASRPASTVRIACLRSSIASTRAVPNFARTRPTNSLFRGVCSWTGGFGGGGAAGFGGTAAGGAAAAGFAGGVDEGAEPLAGLSPAGAPEDCCSLGSSAIDPMHLRAAVNSTATGTHRFPPTNRDKRIVESQTPAFLTHGKNLVNHKNLECNGCS